MIKRKLRYQLVEDLVDKQPEIKELASMSKLLQAAFEKMCSAETAEESEFKRKYPDFVLWQDKICVSDIVNRNSFVKKQLGIIFNTVYFSSGCVSTDLTLVPVAGSLRTIYVYYDKDFPKFTVRKGSLTYWDRFISILKDYVILSNKLYEKQRSIDKFLEITPVPEIKKLCPKIYELYKKHK